MRPESLAPASLPETPAPDGGPTALPRARAAVPPLRVLHLITTLEEGGTEELVLSLARHQAALGCAVALAVLREPVASMRARFVEAGIPVHELGLRRTLDPMAWRRLRRLIAAGEYDIVHTHLDLADLYGPYAAGRGGPRVVSTRHNTDAWRVRRTWKRPFFLAWERAAQRRAAATIAVSRAVRDFLIRHERLDPSRFAVIPNGIDLDPYIHPVSRGAARWEMLRRLEAAGERPPEGMESGAACRVAFVGRFAPQKGADVLLEAAARTPGVIVVLIGDGEMEPVLRARAAQADLAGRVAFAGRQRDLAGVLPGFDLLAVPSRWEGFGLAAVEGMAAGLPVIASRVDGLAEIIEDGRTGRLVAPEDPAALAAAIEEMARDREGAARLGEAARLRALERHGADAMASEVMGLYRRLLGEDAPPATPEVLRLTRRQVRRMWTGILPPRLLSTPPREILARQEHEYAAVANHIEEHTRLAGAALLDLGCGLGTMLLEAGRRGAAVAGLEPDPESLALSRARLSGAPRPGVVVAGVGERLPFQDASFTVITCCSVLEHTRSPIDVLREVSRVLAPGGWLYLGVPNALGCVERHYKVFLPPGTPRPLARAWLRLRGRDPRLLDDLVEMTPRRAERLLLAAGFEIVDSPVERRLARLAATLDRRAIAARALGRLGVAAARRLGLGGVLTGLVRHGFFVDGAWVARRPAGRRATR